MEKFDLEYWRKHKSEPEVWEVYRHPVFNWLRLPPFMEVSAETKLIFDRDQNYLLQKMYQMIVFNFGNAFTRETYTERSLASQNLSAICMMDGVAYSEAGDGSHMMAELSMRQAKRVDSPYPFERDKPIGQFKAFFERARAAHVDSGRGYHVDQPPFAFGRLRISDVSVEKARDFFAKYRTNIQEIGKNRDTDSLYRTLEGVLLV